MRKPTIAAPSRRSFITNVAAGAAGVALAAGCSADGASNPDAALIEKFREWQRLDAAADIFMDMVHPDRAEEARINKLAAELEAEIADIPAHTAMGLAAKLVIVGPYAGFFIDAATTEAWEIFGAKLVDDAKRIAGLAPRNHLSTEA